MKIPVHGEDKTLAYLALQTAFAGLAADVEVPMIAPFRPVDRNGRMVPDENTAGIDGRSLFDHSGFIEEEPVLVTTAVSAPFRATRLVLRHPEIPPLRPGHSFGIKDRIYRIARAWELDYERPGSVGNDAYWGTDDAYWGDVDAFWGAEGATETAGENRQVVEFWPPLREAAPINTPLILGRPVCRMRAVSEDTGILDMGLGIFGEVSVDFEEVI